MFSKSIIISQKENVKRNPHLKLKKVHAPDDKNSQKSWNTKWSYRRTWTTVLFISIVSTLTHCISKKPCGL
jgi:hypothetical protein